MAKLYRVREGFSYPSDPESLKKQKRVLHEHDPEVRAKLAAEVRWTHSKKGEKVTPYNEEILKSWLANDAVEEVKAGG
jgi:hypothetical protein